MNDESETLLDLRGLQAKLDALPPGGEVGIGLSAYRRLFGTNDLALDRATHFARGHRCTIELADSRVVFRKS